MRLREEAREEFLREVAYYEERRAGTGKRFREAVNAALNLVRRFPTAGYGKLKAHWDEEARSQAAGGRHPLGFAQVKTVGPHELHRKVVKLLATTAQPAIVIAACGMCSGGRFVNDLKAMLGDARHDILFCGQQAAGPNCSNRTIRLDFGSLLQTQGPRL